MTRGSMVSTSLSRGLSIEVVESAEAVALVQVEVSERAGVLPSP